MRLYRNYAYVTASTIFLVSDRHISGHTFLRDHLQPPYSYFYKGKVWFITFTISSLGYKPVIDVGLPDVGINNTVGTEFIS